jgi:hypothetical protein
MCRGAKLLCRGFGGVPQIIQYPPRVGARGLKGDLETALMRPGGRVLAGTACDWIPASAGMTEEVQELLPPGV